MSQDSDLRERVEQELEWDPAIDAAAVGVSVEAGAVTLSGHVGSYAERAAAVKAVWRVYGVTAVADDLEVELVPGDIRDDTDIAVALTDAFSWNFHIPAKDIRATVANGLVTLDGSVEWPHQRDEVARVARQLLGVRGINNRITLRTRSVREADQRGIQKRITAALHRQAQIDARRVTVELHGGRVTLRGSVSNWHEAVAARKAAEAAPGVNQVDSLLTIVP